MTQAPERPQTGQDAPYQLMPPLSAEERTMLKEDILKNGVTVPIIFDEDGVILDGHHRAELYYELLDAGHPIPPFPRQVIRGLSEAEKIDRVAKFNLARRHLTHETRAQVFASLRQMGMGLQAIADAAGVGVGTVHRDLASIGTGASAAPAFTVGKDGKEYPTKYRPISIISGEYHQRLQEAAQRKEDRKIVPTDLPVEIVGRYQLHHCDFRVAFDEGRLEPGSVDVIITDPPYPQEFLPLYSDLGPFALRVLKPGGHLVIMSGQYHLPEVYARLHEADAQGLKYRWTGCMSLGLKHTQMWPIKVNTGWKPLLIYTKGDMPADAPWIYDVVTDDEKPDKQYHKWGQSLAGFMELIDKFTVPRQKVLDPFNGGGTTGAAALHSNRLYVGLDNDESCIATTLNRFAHDEDWSHLTEE